MVFRVFRGGWSESSWRRCHVTSTESSGCQIRMMPISSRLPGPIRRNCTDITIFRADSRNFTKCPSGAIAARPPARPVMSRKLRPNWTPLVALRGSGRRIFSDGTVRPAKSRKFRHSPRLSQPPHPPQKSTTRDLPVQRLNSGQTRRSPCLRFQSGIRYHRARIVVGPNAACPSELQSR